MGIIETLSTAYRVLNKRLWLISIPVLLDALLWLGPRLSVEPLITRLLDAAPVASVVAAQPGIDPAVVAETVAQWRTDVQSFAQSFNLVSLLAGGLLGMPSMLAGDFGGDSVVRLPQLVIGVGDVVGLLSAGLVLFLLGLMLASVFLTLVGQLVRDPSEQPTTALRRVSVTWRRMLGFVSLMLILVLMLGFPMIVMMVVASLAGQGPMSFVMGMFWVGMLWTGLYLFFATDAIVVSDMGPLRAIWASFSVVRHNFWASVGLAILVNVILLGTSIAWQRALMGNPVGLMAAVLLNAYIGTGLVVASMLFYKDRYARLRERA